MEVLVEVLVDVLEEALRAVLGAVLGEVSEEVLDAAAGEVLGGTSASTFGGALVVRATAAVAKVLPAAHVVVPSRVKSLGLHGDSTSV
eukprot:874196-Pleurochrysis_carterae.AAC.2